LNRWFVMVFGIVIATGSLAGLRSPASAGHGLAASWLVSYYLDPTSQPGATACINFNKKSESNGVIIGTWASPSIAGWKGHWVSKGQHFAWYGAYTANGNTYSTYDVGDFITTTGAAETSSGVFQVSPGAPLTVNTGTALMTLVSSCKGAPPHRSPNPMLP
jgi:hypothetical protein